MKLKAILLVSMFAMMNPHIANAGFTNTGVIHTRDSQLSSDTFVNNGTIIGDRTVNIDCTEIKGTGVIKGPKINIQTKKFSFTGTIECDGECEIISEEPVDQKTFKQTGSGKFTFTVKK